MNFIYSFAFIVVLLYSCTDVSTKIQEDNKNNSINDYHAHLNKTDSLAIFLKLNQDKKVHIVNNYLDSLKIHDIEKYNILIKLVSARQMNEFEDQLKEGLN